MQKIVVGNRSEGKVRENPTVGQNAEKEIPKKNGSQPKKMETQVACQLMRTRETGATAFQNKQKTENWGDNIVKIKRTTRCAGAGPVQKKKHKERRCQSLKGEEILDSSPEK